MRHSDTSPEAEAIQLDRYRRLSDGERLALALDASRLMRDFALVGLRRDHPDWPESELKRELLRRQFPPDRIPPPLR